MTNQYCAWFNYFTKEQKVELYDITRSSAGIHERSVIPLKMTLVQLTTELINNAFRIYHSIIV